MRQGWYNGFMQYRQYRSDVISVVGFGGICVAHETPQDARRIVDEAINRGVTYFDVAPSYANAEERLGPALEPYRKDVFLACKTTVREAAGAEEEFENSLRLLRTDHFDLYQIHAIQTEEEVDQVLAPGGTLEMITRRRDAGQIRYVGFSAHNEDAALRLLEAFPFDSVLFPINRFVWHAGEVGPRLLEAARARGSEVLALKALVPATLGRRRGAQLVQDVVQAGGQFRRGGTGVAIHPVETGRGGGEPESRGTPLVGV
jgi:predicted aldo/keto reductase-like oxidoreductase